MRKYLIFICTVLLASCLNNDFLERYPLGDPTAETAFETYDNFKSRFGRHTPGDCMKPCLHWAMARKILRTTSRTTRQEEPAKATGSENW